MNYGAGSKDLYLPTLKSNMADHPVFYNNTQFIANTKAFYKDLDRKLDANEDILKNIIYNSSQRINDYCREKELSMQQQQQQEN